MCPMTPKNLWKPISLTALAALLAVPAASALPLGLDAAISSPGATAGSMLPALPMGADQLAREQLATADAAAYPVTSMVPATPTSIGQSVDTPLGPIAVGVDHDSIDAGAQLAVPALPLPVPLPIALPGASAGAHVDASGASAQASAAGLSTGTAVDTGEDGDGSFVQRVGSWFRGLFD